MCDYSLEAFRSTKAKQGENLRLTTFSVGSIPPAHYGSKGFAPEGITDCATCVSEGTILSIEVPEDMQYRHGVSARETVKMVRRNMDTPHSHHDWVEFSTGRAVSLQDFPLNTQAAVVMLADAQAPEDTALTDPSANRNVYVTAHDLMAGIR